MACWRDDLRVGVLEEVGDRAAAHAGQDQPEAAALQEAGQQRQQVGVLLRVQRVRLLHHQILHDRSQSSCRWPVTRCMPFLLEHCFTSHDPTAV